MKIIENKKNNEFFDFVVEIESDEWKKQQEKISKNLAANIKIPGFRKGKVPYIEAIKRIDYKDVLTRAMDKTIQKVAKEIIETDEFKKIEDDILELPPIVDIVTFTKDEIKLKFSYYMFPDISIDGYKDIKLETKLMEITDKEVNAEVDKYLERNAMTVPKENGVVVKGDIVTFDFKGFVNGKAFDGGEAKNYELKIGSGQFIPGFEDQMIGMNIGDKKDINVTFPSDYHEESLAGKPAKFEVLIHSISQVEKSKLDDEFVKSLSIKDVETVDAFKKHIKENLSKQSKQNFEQSRKQEIFKKLLDIAKISQIPEPLVEKEASKLMSNAEHQISMYGMKIDQYLSMLKISKEDWKKQQKEAALTNLKSSMALLKVCELEQIEANEEEIENELARMATLYNVDKEQIRKNFNGNLSLFESMVIERKVLDFFTNNK